MDEHGSGMRAMYWIWGWLLGLTIVEVLLAYFEVPLFWMLLVLMGLSLVKAAMIMAYFMHLKFERLNLVLTLIPAMILTILLLNVIFPDALRRDALAVNRDVIFSTEPETDDGH
jgi:cytochrome c oxidase subunit IV